MFNDLSRLEARFGAQLAERIATRLAVLEAARDLTRVPRRPPIRLRPIGNARGHYTVDLLPPRKLLFSIAGAHGDDGEECNVDEARIEDIQISGVT